MHQEGMGTGIKPRPLGANSRGGDRLEATSMEGRLAATREAMQGIPKAHRSRVELSEFPFS
jgi:hypothetical protein